MKIKDLFNPDVQEILSEESLNAIQEAFDGKVQTSIDAALLEQDELYADKLKALIQTIDKDHSRKMTRILEAKDNADSAKLVKIVKNYERERVTEAKKFKKHVIGAVSSYLEEFLTEAVPAAQIAEACKNNSAFKVLESLRNVLAIDSVMMKESIRGAVMDGKSKQTKLETENKELKQTFKALYEQNQKLQSNMLLEGKISGFPEAKKNFLKKTLSDQSAKFIEENFDYTLRLFQSQESKERKVLKEDAIEKRLIKPDVVPTQKVVIEKVNNDEADNMYVAELSKW